MTRAKVLPGTNSAAKLYRQISCNVFVPEIRTPLLVLHTKDDCVTKAERIPIDDLKRRPNVLMAIYEKGGHCDLYYKKTSRSTGKPYYKQFAPTPTFAFFEQVDKFLEAEQKGSSK